MESRLKQIALGRRESLSLIFRRIFATSRSEMEISIEKKRV